jgi:hypothetical protein
VLCAVLFVLTATVALLLFNLERKLFNAQTYKQALANQNFYERMPALVAQTLVTSSGSLNTCETNAIACGAGERSAEGNACFEDALGVEVYQEVSSDQRNPTQEELLLADACLRQYGLDQAFEPGGPPAFLAAFSADDWEFIISSVLPPEDLKLMTEQGLDSVMSYFNGETNSATVSLAPLKTQLGSEAGIQFAMQMLEAQPPCTDEQLVEMGLSLLSEPRITMCNPPDELNEVIRPLVRGQLQMIAVQIPDQATLIPEPVSAEADPRGGLTTIRLSMRLTPLIALAFLLGITLFAVRNPRDWLNWWGIPFMIAGSLSALMAFAGTSILLLLLQNRVVERMPTQMPVIVVQGTNDMMSAVIRQVVRPVVWQGILLGILGVAMVALAFYQSRREALSVHESPETQGST